MLACSMFRLNKKPQSSAYSDKKKQPEGYASKSGPFKLRSLSTASTPEAAGKCHRCRLLFDNNLLHHCLEFVRLAYCQVGKHLAIQLDVGLLEAIHKSAVIGA